MSVRKNKEKEKEKEKEWWEYETSLTLTDNKDAKLNLPIVRGVNVQVQKMEVLMQYLTHAKFNCDIIPIPENAWIKAPKNRAQKKPYGILHPSINTGVHLVVNKPGVVNVMQRTQLFKILKHNQIHIVWCQDLTRQLMYIKSLSLISGKIWGHVTDIYAGKTSEGWTYSQIKLQKLKRNIESYEHLDFPRYLDVQSIEVKNK